MLIKADYLHMAGIINEAEKQYVHSRARTFLDDVTLKDAAFLKSHAAYNVAICYFAVTPLTERFCRGRNEDGNGVDHGRHQYPSWTWWFAWYPIMHKGERIWLRWIQRRWHDRRLGDGWYEYR
jgi:hypothetical protein